MSCERGGNPIVAIVVLFAMMLLLGGFYLLFAEPVRTVANVAKEAAPEASPKFPYEYAQWLPAAILICGLVFASIWFVTYLMRKEWGVETI